MHVGILPIAVVAAGGLVAFAVWALLGGLKERRAGRRVGASRAVAVLVCGVLLWLMLSVFFMVLASLGHSPHPLRDSWVPVLVSLVVLVCAPAAVLIWSAGRGEGS